MEDNFQGGVPTGTQNPGLGGASQGGGDLGGSGVNISHVEQDAVATNAASTTAQSVDAQEGGDEAAIHQFVEGLIMKKGLTDMNELQNLKNELSEELVEQINQSLLYALNDEEFAKLEAKGDGLTEDDFRAAIRNSGVDVEKVTKETVEKFENVFMGIKLEEVA